MSALYIDVKAYAGRDIAKIIGDMIDLADRIGINIWCDLNGVRTLASPGDDRKVLHEAWEAQLSRDAPYKIASTRVERSFDSPDAALAEKT